MTQSVSKAGIKVAFLGSGNMSEAIIKGVLEAGLFKAGDLLASDPSEERLQVLQSRHGVNVTRSNLEAVRVSELLILGVKPMVIDLLLTEIKSEVGKKGIVSIAAGIPISRFTSVLTQDARIIRAMPNAPAQVQSAATVLTPGNGVDEDLLARVVSIFSSIGTTAVLEERFLDAVTGLSGSGPAFVFVMIEAMADGGVKQGLPRDIALSLATQTVMGAARMVLLSGEHPAYLKDLVASPGGTTISGLYELEAGKMRAALIAAVEAATQRAVALGKG